MIDSTMFVQGWHDLIRAVVLAPLGYLAVALMLRASRQRTLSHTNVFDFVYIIVIGGVLATTIISDDVPLLRGVLAVGVLIGLQVVVSWLTTRFKTIEHLVNGEPALLFHRGRFLRESMHAQRVTEQEVVAAARMKGVADLSQVEAVVLETDGEFSVVHFGDPRRDSTLRDVPGVEARGSRREGYAKTAS